MITCARTRPEAAGRGPQLSGAPGRRTRASHHS